MEDEYNGLGWVHFTIDNNITKRQLPCLSLSHIPSFSADRQTTGGKWMNEMKTEYMRLLEQMDSLDCRNQSPPMSIHQQVMRCLQHVIGMIHFVRNVDHFSSFPMFFLSNASKLGVPGRNTSYYSGLGFLRIYRRTFPGAESCYIIRGLDYSGIMLFRRGI